MALVYQSRNPLEARDELAAFFLLTTPLSLLVLLFREQLMLDHLLVSLKLLPGVLVGYGLSKPLQGRFNQTSPRRLLLLISLLAALGLLGISFWRLVG